jgi:uncharacterized protein (TIGR02266 family)
VADGLHGGVLMIAQQQSMERTRWCEVRRDRRAHIPRVSVRYEVGPGRFVVGDALEMSEGGIFILATKPVRPKSLIEVEIRVLGETSPILAIGRVVWTREVDGGEGRPTGMGVKLVDMEDAARALIARLVAVRQPTMHGIGVPPVLPAYAAPVVVRPMEASIPFYLVTRKGPPVSRVPLRARDVALRLLVAAGVLAFVILGPRDSGVEATHRASVAVTSAAIAATR